MDVNTLIDRYAPSVYRLAYAHTGSSADAEDVMQETFLRLLTARPQLNGDDHARAWLLRVAANCAADLHRARRRVVPLEEAHPAPPMPDSSVLDAVLALPEPYRIPIHLHYYEGYQVAEIARILDLRENTVKTRLFRGRALLRDALKGDDCDVPEGV